MGGGGREGTKGEWEGRREGLKSRERGRKVFR